MLPVKTTATTILTSALLVSPSLAERNLPEGVPSRPVATYSIVARDAATGQMGVAVQSHWFSVGSVVSWAEAGVGAVATQSLVDVRYGYEGLERMRAGSSAPETLASLVREDAGEHYRQVAMVDANGGAAQHTGELCIASAGQISGRNADGTVWLCQANMMLDSGVPEAMAHAFENAPGDLAERLMVALEAAQVAGGDIRGKQSAAILVVAADAPDRPWEGRLVDLRIEDHASPISEMRRLLTLHRAYEHMNAGDVAMENGDMSSALREYGAAMSLAPDNIEMIFWTAVSLASAGDVDDALPLFQRVFAAPDGEHWRELLRRLPDSNLFPANKALLDQILRAGN
jgi:uncharacterized Ntn-hydrolase superfamily protein